MGICISRTSTSTSSSSDRAASKCLQLRRGAQVKSRPDCDSSVMCRIAFYAAARHPTTKPYGRQKRHPLPFALPTDVNDLGTLVWQRRIHVGLGRHEISTCMKYKCHFPADATCVSLRPQLGRPPRTTRFAPDGRKNIQSVGGVHKKSRTVHAVLSGIKRGDASFSKGCPLCPLPLADAA